jgi:cysteine-rich repeat protein
MTIAVRHRAHELAVFLLLFAAASVHAHGTPADLSVWGNFGAETARCQRTIARAATLCSGRALAARTACAAAQLRGEACDTAESDARIQAARQRALDMVEEACEPQQLQTLRYVDLSDALADVIDICREQDTAAVTAAYGPAMFGGTIAAVEGSAQICLDATGRAAGRLLRFAMRARQQALDQIAATPMTLAEKQDRLARSEQMIARVIELSRRRLLALCTADEFEAAYGQDVDDFLARIAGRADCLAQSVYVQNAVTCPPPVCGDGMQTTPEQCDDGNAYEGDGCRADCVKTECDVFPTTYDLIQKAIFDNHGCSEDACHGSARSGGLDLRAGASYQNLIDADAGSVGGWKRIAAGDKDQSLLWINLAAATLPDHFTAPLRAMPLGLPPLSTDELEALRLWIENGGAAREAQLPAAAALLDACVPEPRPIEIEPLDPPPAGTGLQLHMPAYVLPAKTEWESCFSSYYDLSDQIPAQFLSEDGQHFRYKSVDIRQDPLSHHLIVDLFRGSEPANDPSWGVYKCRGGARDGEVCDPLDIPFCGAGQCATDPDTNAIACIGFGPTAGLGTLTSGGFAFAQETTAHYRFPGGVYDELPVRGVILWNSHAFNLTRHDGTLEAWVNINFPAVDEQQFQQEQIFNISKIFWTDAFPPFPAPKLAAFADMEVCDVHVFGAGAGFGDSALQADETAHLFELSGHTHRHGKRFQIFRGRFVCSDGPNAGAACSPFEPQMCPAAACVEDGGRDPQDALLYTNLVYNDPLVLRFDPPILISGTAPLADRTFTYCGHYSNGKEPNLQDVKRRSTSPPAGVLFGVFSVGGPCSVAETRCIGGPHHNELCNGTNAMCDSAAGAGDGDCDACPIGGGFRTQDEMFVLFGNYWVTKN